MYTPLSGQDPASVPYDASAPLREQVCQSVAASLRNLRGSYVDCLLLHSPLSNHNDMMEVWRAMEVEVERGRARMLGLSNCYQLPVLQKLWSEAAVKPRVVQNRWPHIIYIQNRVILFFSRSITQDAVVSCSN
jgi:diketogulonate reductase-like aldo/keto reductase